MSENVTPLLEVKDLKKWFPSSGGIFEKRGRYVKAVNGVSLSINRGETLGVVGESGCGKSTLGRTIIRLIEPTGGQVKFMGEDYLALSGEDLRRKRRHMQIIFQDPYASLDPRMTVGDLIGEPLDIQKEFPNRKDRNDRVLELLDIVGLSQDYVQRYAHEFSGGQRQRIGIARALALRPQMLICDEPVSALDVSIQAQILNLMEEIQSTLGVTFLFISHDLSVVKYVSNNVAVMYLGKVVEIAPKAELYSDSRHPYTKALLSAIPIPDTRVKKKRVPLFGDIPSPIDLPSGCCFRTRCPQAQDICTQQEPELTGADGHMCACHFQ